jgi:simple sugar transport system substrate-binding protein
VRRGTACLQAAVLAMVALALAGCGAAQQVREPDLVIESSAPRPADIERDTADDKIAIEVVTHGEAASTFWTIVRNGLDAAERQMDVDVDHRAADVYNPRVMAGLIDAAVAREPDGLVVSIPSAELVPAIRRAIAAGIPVVSINSGSGISRRLGTLAHIGQPEEKAGYRAGLRLVAEGATNGLCVNQEVGNEGLDRRCAGFARALRESGARSRVVKVDDRSIGDTRAQIVEAAGQPGVDAVLALNNKVGQIAAESLPRDIAIGTFDYSPEVLKAIEAGRILFAVDQQPYLQGYLPIVFLAERARYGLFPAQGEVVPTGPNFVTRDNAAQAARLSQLGIR